MPLYYNTLCPTGKGRRIRDLFGIWMLGFAWILVLEIWNLRKACSPAFRRDLRFDLLPVANQEYMEKKPPLRLRMEKRLNPTENVPGNIWIRNGSLKYNAWRFEANACLPATDPDAALCHFFHNMNGFPLFEQSVFYQLFHKNLLSQFNPDKIDPRR